MVLKGQQGGFLGARDDTFLWLLLKVFFFFLQIFSLEDLYKLVKEVFLL